VTRAVEAHLARRGIQRHYLHAFLESANAGADFFDYAGEFVSEQGRRDDHAGVVAALIDLEIGAAGQRGLHAQDDLAGTPGATLKANGSPCDGEVDHHKPFYDGHIGTHGRDDSVLNTNVERTSTRT